MTSPSAGAGSGAGRVGAGILVSRIAGFVRDAVLAAYLGSSRFADIWYLGLRTPNVIQNLLGEGTLSASLIPVYARMLGEGRDEAAGRFAGAALGLVTVAAFGLALVGIAIAPWLVPTLYPELDPGATTLLVTVVRILMPMAATLAVSAWALGILNSHGRLFVAYVAPVAWNIAIITVAVAAGSGLGLAAAGRQADLVVAVAWGALLGGGLQLGVLLRAAGPVLRHVRASLDLRVEGVREAIRAFGPVVLGRGVVNLSALLDALLAALLVEGAVAHLARAQTLYLVPISLFGMSVAAAELPALSRIGADQGAALAERVRGALERVGVLLVPSTLAFLFMGDFLVETLFERGAFGRNDTWAVTLVLAAYSLGLLASGRSRTLASAFYALRDSATPARVAAVRVAVSTGVGIALMFPLDRYGVGTVRFGAAGLALGSAVGAWLEYALLRRGLSRRLPGHGPRFGQLMRLAGAATAGAAVLVGARLFAEPWVRAAVDRVWAGPLLAAGTGLTFGVVYLWTAALLGLDLPIPARLRRLLPGPRAAS